LAAADEVLDGLLYAGLWFWLRWICFALYFLLGWIQAVIPTWGIAIMTLSLAVHILMLPLSRLADRLQRQVNATENRLAPELSRIKREYRGEEQAHGSSHSQDRTGAPASLKKCWVWRWSYRFYRRVHCC
jgi:membrane protein insertase Oxa1/YidC/SpoIIIJ